MKIKCENCPWFWADETIVTVLYDSGMSRMYFGTDNLPKTVRSFLDRSDVMEFTRKDKKFSEVMTYDEFLSRGENFRKHFNFSVSEKEVCVSGADGRLVITEHLSESPHALFTRYCLYEYKGNGNWECKMSSLDYWYVVNTMTSIENGMKWRAV